MSYSVLNAKAELTGMLHGTTLDQIVNITGIFNRAARQLLLDVDPKETIAIEQLGTIYEGVYDYTCPSKLKGNKVIDIRPQSNRKVSDRYSQVYSQDFDVFKDISLNRKFTVNYNNGVKTIRLDTFNLNRSISINIADSIAGNGTWAVSGTASNLSVDTVNTMNDAGNLSFDITSGTGVIANSTMTAVDLTAHLNQSLVFFDVYLPDASDFTSVTIKFGTDSSNYWSSTLTTNFQGNAFVDGYNLLAANWSSKTGSPDVADIKYVSISFVCTDTNAGVKIGDIISRLGVIAEIEYYTNCIFRSSAGVFKSSTDSDSDLINLEEDGLNIYLFLVSFYCVQQALGQTANFDASVFVEQYQADLARYKRMYKSETVHPQRKYYQQTPRGYRRYMGRAINY